MWSFLCNLQSIWMSSGEKCLFNYSISFLKIRLFHLCVVDLKEFLYIPDVNTLSDTWFATVFPFHRLPLYWVNSAWKILILMKCSVSIFVAIPDVKFKKLLQNLRLWNVSLMFSWRSFAVLAFTFMSLIYFELNFAYGIR